MHRHLLRKVFFNCLTIILIKKKNQRFEKLQSKIFLISIFKLILFIEQFTKYTYLCKSFLKT